MVGITTVLFFTTGSKYVLSTVISRSMVAIISLHDLKSTNKINYHVRSNKQIYLISFMKVVL